MKTKKEKEQGPKKVVPPKVKSKSLLLWLARKNAQSIWWPIGFALILTFVLWGIVSLVYCCSGNSNPLGKAFSDIVSPVTARNVAYESYGRSVPQCDSSQVKLVSVENDERSVFWLSLAYFFGSVIFSGLFVATITNSLRTWADRFKQGTFRLHRISGHIVILGYNDMVPGLIKRILDDQSESSRKVLVGVKGRADEKYNQICDQADLNGDECWRVVVFHVDNMYEEHLKKRLRVHQANDVYIIGEEDDALNLNAYNKICEINKKENSDRWIPECYVQMQYQSTFALFQTYTKKEGMEHFHAFNFQDEWARKMIMREQIDTRDGQNITTDSDKYVHLVIIGMTEMGEALAREAAFLCHYPNYVTKGIRTKLTFIDPQAEEQMTYFMGRYHHLFELCRYKGTDEKTFVPKKDFIDIEFEFIQANVAENTIQNQIAKWAADHTQVLTIAVCADMPHRSMAAGLYLPDEVFDNNIPVWVYQPAKGDMGEYLGGSRFNNVITFGMSGKELDIKNEKIVQQAKRLNHFYCHLSDETIDYTGEMVIEKEWDSCNVFDKWSNIYNVSVIPAKLRSVNDLEKSKETLAKLEHNRWNVEKLLMGFRSTTEDEHEKINPEGKTDEEKKSDYKKKKFAHDNIRPFSELDDAAKDIDRKITQEIPNIIGNDHEQI